MGFLSSIGKGLKSFSDTIGGISPLMDIGSSALGFLSNERANEQSRAMSREAMNFEERMSNTAFQRAKSDLLAAGMNPMLAVGHSASTPSGQMGDVKSSADVIQRGFSAASAHRLEAQSIAQNIATSKAQEGLYSAQSEKTAQEKARLMMENAVMESAVPFEREWNKWKMDTAGWRKAGEAVSGVGKAAADVLAPIGSLGMGGLGYAAVRGGAKKVFTDVGRGNVALPWVNKPKDYKERMFQKKSGY